jgi:hypothetical protein
MNRISPQKRSPQKRSPQKRSPQKRSPQKRSPKKSTNVRNNVEEYTDEQLETIISYLSNQLEYYDDIQGKRKINKRILNNKKLPKKEQLL